MKKTTFCFICSPGLGILENWLPILHELKSHNPNAKFICLFTKVSNIEQIARVNVLISIAGQIFDEIVFKSYSDIWIQAKTFEQAEGLVKLGLFESYFIKVTKILSRFSLGQYLSGFLKQRYKYFDPRRKKDHIININELMGTVDAVLYDISEEKKQYIKEIFDNYKGKNKFSIHHGIDVFKSKKPLSSKYHLTEEKITQFTFSEYDREYYRKSYNLDDANIIVTGVPRHDEHWKRMIIESQTRLSGEIEWDDYVFIISRSMSDYFPYERKKKAINDIKKIVIEDLGKKIIIKLHPKEINNKLYEEVLGADNYGEKWNYSNSHPFVLASKCAFAISFYSNVAIDMIVSNVPTIEYLDLKNINKYDNTNSLRDSSGAPVFDWRYNGLVLGASDYSQLKIQINKIIKDRDSTMKYLYKNYMAVFLPPTGSPGKIISRNITNEVKSVA